MKKRLSGSEIFDVDKKTGALILGTNRLEDYATKFLTKHCPEALKTPMALPVDKILESMGLSVRECTLSEDADVFGCCFLVDGNIKVFERDKHLFRVCFFKSGTILIDPECMSEYGEGFKRNTLVHEVVHWEKDKAFFEILNLKKSVLSESTPTIMCRTSETFYEPSDKKKTKDNEIEWLEWQAHRLAPRILMPYDSFRKKALEIIEKASGVAFCKDIVSELSDFFVVSATSVKYRLKETGLESKLIKLDDYKSVFEEINNYVTYYKLSTCEAFELFFKDFTLRKWILSGRYVFTEGFFVFRNKNYLEYTDDAFKIKKITKDFFEKAVLKIKKYNVADNFKEKDVSSSALFSKVHDGVKIIEFKPYLERKRETGDDET